MDVLDCIKYMISESGQSVRKVSILLGRSPTYLGTTFGKKSDIGASNAARIARLLGWKLVFKRGDEELEVSDRADSDKGSAD